MFFEKQIYKSYTKVHVNSFYTFILLVYIISIF